MSTRTILRDSVVVLFADLALAVGGWAAPADAASQAKKQLETSAATVLADFRSEANLHRAVLFSTLDLIDAEVASGANGMDRVDDVFDALCAFQQSIASEISEAVAEFRDDSKSAIAVLIDAGIPRSEWPKGFHYGDGGISDELNSDVDAALRKLKGKVEDRMRVTASLLKKHAQVALNFRLEPPNDYVEWAVTATGWSGVVAPPVTVDVAMGASRLDADSDGVLYACGSMYDPDGLVHLTIARATESSIGTISGGDQPMTSNRWTMRKDGLDEGSYVTIASDDGTTSGRALAIAIR